MPGVGRPHLISVVVPVYQGEHTIGELVAELHQLAHPTSTPDGATFRVAEIILVGPAEGDHYLAAGVTLHTPPNMEFEPANRLAIGTGALRATEAAIDAEPAFPPLRM